MHKQGVLQRKMDCDIVLQMILKISQVENFLGDFSKASDKGDNLYNRSSRSIYLADG